MRVSIGVALLLAFCACKEAEPEPFVRLREPAPARVTVPRGEAHLVALWGSWCPPCREETPALQALARNPPQGIAITIVAVNEAETEARVSFPGAHVIADPDGDLAGDLRTAQLPAAYLVAGDRVVARFDGPRAWNDERARRTLARLAKQAIDAE